MKQAQSMISNFSFDVFSLSREPRVGFAVASLNISSPFLSSVSFCVLNHRHRSSSRCFYLMIAFVFEVELLKDKKIIFRFAKRSRVDFDKKLTENCVIRELKQCNDVTFRGCLLTTSWFSFDFAEFSTVCECLITRMSFRATWKPQSSSRKWLAE